MTTEDLKQVLTTVAVCRQLIGQMPHDQVNKVVHNLDISGKILNDELTGKEKGGKSNEKQD